jgi:hypothetical protein
MEYVDDQRQITDAEMQLALNRLRITLEARIVIGLCTSHCFFPHAVYGGFLA